MEREDRAWRKRAREVCLKQGSHLWGTGKLSHVCLRCAEPKSPIQRLVDEAGKASLEDPDCDDHLAV